MAHTIVIGRFGSGKSTFGTLLAIQELMRSDRWIVTTLALHVREINCYLQEKHPERDYRALQRILILDREQLGKFWRYRGISGFGEYGPEPDLWGSVDNLEGRTADARWTVVSKGVCYILDEAPSRFHSRMWGVTGIEFSSYINQHRKVGDDVYSLARHSSMLDKQFRTTADRCVVLDNWYQKSFGRFIKFTAPKRIKYYEYESCPPERGEVPFNQGAMFIDPRGLSRCFNTAGGLGISGVMGGADIGKKAKGLPWWTTIVAVVGGVGLALFLAIRAMNFAVGHRPQVSSSLPGGVPVVSPVVSSLQASNYGIQALQALQGLKWPGRGEVKSGPKDVGEAARPGAVVEPSGCRGYARVNNRYYLDTDEGLLEGDKLMVSNLFVFLDGVPFRHRDRKESGSPVQR